MTDYLDRDALLALDIDPATVERLLADSLRSGHGGQPLIPADELQDRLAMLDREEG